MNPENQGGQSPYGSVPPQPQGYAAPQYPQNPAPGQLPQPLQTGTPSPQIFQAPQTPPSRNWVLISAVVVLLVLFLGAGSAAIWAYSHYKQASTNVDSQIADAKAQAIRDQKSEDETNFLNREKQPNKQFVGPDNYGRVTFNYPKTWSAYVASDGDTSGQTYQAYLNPGVVPPANGSDSVFALRVTIQQIDYSQALSQYQSKIKSGDLKSSSVSVNGHDGTRFDGKLTEDLRGSTVLFQIRDKVLILQTDANTFLPDYNAIIASVDFKS